MKRPPASFIVVGYIGPIAEGEQLVAPVRKFGVPLADTIGPMSYGQLSTMLDDAFPYGGVQRYWKSSFLKQLGDDVLDILADRAANMPSPMSMVGFFHVHGGASRVDRNETAFGLRDDQSRINALLKRAAKAREDGEESKGESDERRRIFARVRDVRRRKRDEWLSHRHHRPDAC